VLLWNPFSITNLKRPSLIILSFNHLTYLKLHLSIFKRLL